MQQMLVVELDGCLQLLTRVIGGLARRGVCADSIRVRRRGERFVLAMKLSSPQDLRLSDNFLDQIRETVGVRRAEPRLRSGRAHGMRSR